MAFNAEVSCEARDKRVASMEKILNAQAKQVQAGDPSKLAKELVDLSKKHEELIKKLAEMAKKQEEEAKLREAQTKKLDNLEKAIITVAASLKDPKKFVEKAGLDMVDKDQSAKIAEAVSKREAEKSAKEAKAQAEKMVKDLNLETRLNIIEGKLASLGR